MLLKNRSAILQLVFLFSICFYGYSLKNDSLKWLFDNFFDLNHDGNLSVSEIAYVLLLVFFVSKTSHFSTRMAFILNFEDLETVFDFLNVFHSFSTTESTAVLQNILTTRSRIVCVLQNNRFCCKFSFDVTV
jgi:hypothetical protein